MQTLNIKTNQKKQVVNLTQKVNKVIKDSKIKHGVCTVHILHTTAAISTADLDSGTDKDMLDAFDKIIPDLEYRHPHDPAHVPDHIIATLIGSSVNIPFENGKLLLGTWQNVCLFEFDGPQERKVVIILK